MEIKAPKPIPLRIFLAGSIEMGVAEDWQARVTKMLSVFEDEVIILNPRRDDWDSSWEQSIDNPNFREQVEWELDGLEKADKIILYFSPGTKSPISLLELGLFATRDIYVCCPDGFWRKGNVEIVCKKYCAREMFHNLNELLEVLRVEISSGKRWLGEA